MRKIPVRRLAPSLIEQYFRYGKQLDNDQSKPSACLTRRADEWSGFGPRAEVVICSRKPRGGNEFELTSTGYVLIDDEPMARTTVTREEAAPGAGILVPYPDIDLSKE